MRYKRNEILDIGKAWLAISLAFAIVMEAGLNASFLTSFIIAALTVGVGFIFHELSHKFVAQHYGHRAEFRSFDTMLILAIMMSFFGFIIAAPGAVMIMAQVNEEENGKISAAGIIGSLTVAALFLVLGYLVSGGMLQSIAEYGLIINSWLAIFNLIPLGVFDGSKVWRWNKFVYSLLAITGLGLLYIGGASVL